MKIMSLSPVWITDEFDTCLVYTARPCLKNEEKEK
jgi:hypothetical protein